ncbi:right-handed parallel beta-helix repeat-containing protein [Ruegeria sp. HKCCA4812]|uniref:right-handed parallel beta-helix repeat-containing protein n=1 Tax=Ruegeria sp. HKCCA4812 TaxID=2682993 RepID=UPI0014878FFD|nr:right-handed parallel beta-helix repeat-containing protein [Ruegeria sp. HKCCA4812]
MSTTIIVTSAAELNQALSQASGGETILLTAGDYGSLNLHNTNFASNVTIQSADPNAKASFSAVHLKQSSNITFDSIKFDYSFSGGDHHFQSKFGVYDSQNITFNNSIFDGDVASGTGTSADGTGYGTGLNIAGSTNININNTEFSQWWKAVIAVNSDGINVTGNDIHTIRSDGLVFDNVDNILVENNHLHDFGGAAGSGDHRDMIQIQRAYGSGSDNITIRNNLFDMANGDFTQTIWAGGDGKNIDDPSVIHHNVLIEGNTIYNGHFHGISLYGVDGLTITKNSVLHVDEKTLTGGIEIPAINVSAGSKNVTIDQNITSQIVGYNGQADWNVANNALIQPSEYDQNFTYQATAQGNGYNQYVVVPGSLADTLNAGSAVSHGATGSTPPQQVTPGGSQPNTNPTPPDSGSGQPDTGSGQPDTGSEQPDTGSEQPDTGSEQPDTGSEQPDTGSEQPDTGSEQPDTGSEQTDTGSEQPDAESEPVLGADPQGELMIDITHQDSPETIGRLDEVSYVGKTHVPADETQAEGDTSAEQPDTGSEPAHGGGWQSELSMIDISNQNSRGNIGTLDGISDASQVSFSVDITRDEGETGAERLVWNHSNFGLKLNKKGHLVAKVDNNDDGFRKGFKIKDVDLNDGETHQVTLMVDQDTDRLQIMVDGAVVLDETNTDFDFAGGQERDWYVGDSVDTFAIGEEAPFVEPYSDLFA